MRKKKPNVKQSKPIANVKSTTKSKPAAATQTEAPSTNPAPPAEPTSEAPAAVAAPFVFSHPAHPAAELFPLIVGDDFDRLVADVRVRGVIDPAVLFADDEGKTWLLDGRNRERAASAAGVVCPQVVWNGEGGSPLGYVLSRNTHRRHLTPSQLAAIAAEALPMFEAEAKDRQRAAAERTNAARSGEPVDSTLEVTENAGEAREQAAKAVGASPRYVSDAKAIREAAPEVHEEVKAGTVTIPEGKRIAELPAEERKTALDDARANKAKGKKRAKKKAPAPVTKPSAEALTDVRDGMTVLSKALLATPTSSRGDWWAPLREALRVAKKAVG